MAEKLNLKENSPAEDDKAARQWASYVRAREAGHTEYVEQAELYDRYYLGDQWDEAVRRELDAQRRPANTINLVLSTVNAAVGEQISNRHEITIKPTGRGATLDVASALRRVFDQIDNANQSKWNETMVFTDGIIQERGYFDIRIDFSENMQGEINETVLSPLDVVLDPDAREYDPDTWSELYITRWMSPDTIAGLFGDEWLEKLEYANPTETYGPDSVQFHAETFGDDKVTYGLPADSYDDEWRRVRQVRVIERQYRKLQHRVHMVDPVTGEMRPVPDDWSPERLQAVMAQTGVQLVKKPEQRIRMCLTADGHTLSDEWSLYRRFTVVPYFPYFRRGRPMGVVRNLISPQDLLNKVSSQELHVVNTTANSGWIFEENSLANMDAAQLAAEGAKTGLTLEVRRGATFAPKKIEPNSVPTGLDRIGEKASFWFREISGVNEAMLGNPGREISGIALENKQSRGLVQMEVVFDNLAKSRYFRARHMLELVQRFYTETRLLYITTLNDMGEDELQELQINQPTPEGKIINDLSMGEYSIVIANAPARDTSEETQFAKLMSMRENGVLIPDYFLIERSGVDGAREIAEVVRQIMGQAEPTEQEIEQAEIMRQLEMEAAMASLDELKAKAQERMANAQLKLAEAQARGEEITSSMQELMMTLQSDMQKATMELQQKREELMTRLLISREKNDSVKFGAQLQSLTSRLGDSQKSQTAVAVASLSAAAQAQRAKTQARKPAKKA